MQKGGINDLMKGENGVALAELRTGKKMFGKRWGYFLPNIFLPVLGL
jgi:hypothetical protein